MPSCRPRRSIAVRALLTLCGLSLAMAPAKAPPRGQAATMPASPPATGQSLLLAAAECTAAKIGDSIPAKSIGAPVAGVTLAEPKWVPATGALPARCEIEGRMAPADASATARPINFRVWLPAAWNGRAVQQGGSGMDGFIPDLTGGQYPIGGRSLAQLGYVTYGSDSAHQAPSGPRGGTPGRGGPEPPGTQRDSPP